ncbi:MAG: hypothetical protein ACE5GO_01250 [Anaerolineales bacterium]
MKPHSRYVIHVGINFITIPAPVITPLSALSFQQAIIANGLEFVSAENPKNKIILTRESPSPLQITVSMLEPQVGQILVVAPNPKGSLKLFIQEMEAALKAFETVWPAQNRQIIKSDATLRELHETTSQHAFQELWEKRLGQPTQSLAVFERPIRGGGLRFVMDPLPNEDEPVRIEVKIESFLGDTTKIFVETQFIWLKPTSPGTPIEPGERLSQMNAYIEKQVHSFLSGEDK